MATNVTTLVAGVYIPELWAREVQKAREKNLVAAKHFFDVSSFGEINKKGDILHVPKLSNYEAIDKVANTELPSSATTEAEVTLTIDNHKGIRIAVEDIAQAQSSQEMMALYTGKVGYGLAKATDSSILGLWSGLSQTVGATASTDAGIAYTNVVRASRFLDGADAPREDRVVIIDEYGLEDLRLITEFTRYDAAGQGGNNNAFISGAMGSIMGMPVYVTTNLGTTSVVGGTLSRGIIAHKEAFMYAMQKQKELEQWRNGPQLATELIGQTLYGVGEYRDDHGVVLSYPRA